MTYSLERYIPLVGRERIDQLRQLAAALQGKKVVHVNSTKTGGGVAEILTTMVPHMNELGISTSWEVVEGDVDYFHCTKSFHNGLQGNSVALHESLLRHYELINKGNADRLSSLLRDADIVVIHDPQPLALISHFPDRRGKWLWRCHIDVSHPYPPIWNYLEQFVVHFDAAVFSLPDFVPPLKIPTYIMAPSIDPLSEKNIDLSEKEIAGVYGMFGLDPKRPILLQVSRFDRFKDQIGVIAAYKLIKKFHQSVQLVLVGGSAQDDPEGEAVLQEVRLAAGNDPDIHTILLPADSNRTVNALQRAADIIIQKSLKEGFGLTVTEGLWKGKPVIGGDAGGIRLQVIDHHTGFLVHTPEGAANRIRYLLENREKMAQMGIEGHEFAREKFLITRNLLDYLGIFIFLHHPLIDDRVEL